MKQFVNALLVSIIVLTGISCSNANAQSSEITELRDSLDMVQFDVPTPMIQVSGNRNVIRVCSQSKWNNLESRLEHYLKKGCNNIEIRITGKDIVFGENPIVITDWKYPEANIRIVGNKAKMQPYGFTFKRCDKDAKVENDFYSLLYAEFDINDIVVDKKGNEVSLREDTRQVSGNIEQFMQLGQDVWRFMIDMPDLTEEQCKDFYVLMTRDWTSARHKVLKVQDGWLYYHLDSEDLHSDRNPNVDWTQYKVRPRYTLINSPISNGVHVVDGRIYIPNHYKEIRVNKGSNLITFSYCHFNSLEITGFDLNGCGGGSAIGIYSSTFDKGAFIYGNTFTNMSDMAIQTSNSINVVISDNTVTKTRVQAIAAGGVNTTVARNHLSYIGWMLNTRAITGGGENLHICDNVIEDFNYSAIAVGSTTPNDKATRLTYIIERNEIHLSNDYTDNYILNTLADGGGIYTGPQCTWGIIRNNVIENIKGIHSNRGIFLDDGAKNLAIYGNLIMNTSNSYDIDLRYTDSFADMIPDHNTNNSVFHNIITGGYRFQCKNGNSNCLGGNNILLQIDNNKRVVVDLSNMTLDIKLDGCRYIKGKIVIPRHNKFILDSINVDPFVRRYLSFKN